MNDATIKIFQAKLAAFRSEQKQRAVKSALYRWLAMVIPVWLLVVAFNAILLLPSGWRIIVLGLTVGSTGLAFIRNVGPDLYRWVFQRHIPSLNQIALQVGEGFSQIHDRLANALQLLRKLDTNTEAYSNDLIRAAFADVATELQDRNFDENSNRPQERRSALRLLKVFLASAFVWFVFSPKMQTGAVRLLHPQQDFQIPATAVFSVFPGDATVLKGQDLLIKIRPNDRFPATMQLRIRKQGDEEILALSRSNDDTLRHRFFAVRDSFQYRVQAGKINSRWYRVSVMELAMIRTLQVKLYPPAYSHQDPFLLPENMGDISSLRGSRVEIRAQVNKAIDTAFVVFNSGKRQRVQIADHQLSAGFVVEKDDRYTFSLSDTKGQATAAQIEYHISAIADQYPFIRIAIPGRDVELTEEMLLPLLIEAQDDYGISKIQLVYQVLAAGEEEIDSTRFLRQHIPAPLADQVRVAFQWDLSGSPLLPNETILYGVQVYDNDAVSGPKTSRSPFYRARFPSLYEMYQELAKHQEEAIEQMESVYERSKELLKSVDELQQDFRRDSKIDWQKKQQVEASLKQQEQMKQQLEQLSQTLEEMVQKMETNNLVSLETLKKYQELQQAYQEIMTPELQKVMQQLSESMQNLDPNLVKKALEELKLSAEDINKNLDRTISLLKKFKMEQQLDRAVHTARNLAEEQKRISDQAQQPQQTANEKLQEEQKNLSANTDQFDEMLKKINKEMDQQPGMPQQEVQKALDRLEAKPMNENLQQMKNMLQKGGAAEMGQCSENIQKDFKAVARDLQEAKDKLSGAQQAKTMQALQQGMRDLLELSKKQEELLNRSERSQLVGNEIPKIAEEQQNLSSGLSRVTEQIFDASKSSFYVDSKIGSALGQAAKSMSNSLQSLEERNSGTAAGQQGQAMASLNRATLKMHAAMQAMMQGGGGGGRTMDQFMQQMQSMANAQQGINQQTLGLGMGGQMSMAQQAGMARLAAEQGTVRKSLEQLAQEAGNLPGSLGSLDKMVEDMKQVESDLGRRVTHTTIQRQQQILSRMLDSQKSIREREYGKNRKAETGKQYIGNSPRELPQDLGDRKEKWQQDLLRAKKEGYTRDYLDLIKHYFEALFEGENAHN